MSTLQVEVVAADRKVWEGEATLVSARSVEGEVGIMRGHQPLFAVLADGDVRIKSPQGDQVAHVDGGFISVDHDRVTIVAEVVTTD